MTCSNTGKDTHSGKFSPQIFFKSSLLRELRDFISTACQKHREKRITVTLTIALYTKTKTYQISMTMYTANIKINTPVNTIIALGSTKMTKKLY